MLEKQQNQLSGKGTGILAFAIGLIVVGGVFGIKPEASNVFSLESFGYSLIMLGGLVGGMVIGILWKAENLGSSLIKPIQQ